MTARVHGADDCGRTRAMACVAALHALREATLSELAQATGLSRPTVKDRLAELPGLVEVTTGAEHGESPTPNGGRPAARFRFRAEYGYVVGAELGKNDERMLVCDIGGQILYRGCHHDVGSLPGWARVRAFRTRLARVVGAIGPEHGRWLGLGVALTGGIAPDGGIAYAPHYPDLEGLSAAEAGLAFGDVPVIIEHDLKAAAIAEHAYGAAREAETLVLALAWHQLAAGIVLDGRVHRGARNLAGELNLVDDGPAAPLQWADVESFLPVLDAADRGDQDALAQVDDFAQRAARHIAYLTLSIDPELVVLGGPLAHRGTLTDRIAAHLTGLLRHAYPVRLAVARFPTIGPSLGALQMALSHAFVDLLGDPAFPARIDIRSVCSESQGPDRIDPHTSASAP